MPRGHVPQSVPCAGGRVYGSPSHAVHLTDAPARRVGRLGAVSTAAPGPESTTPEPAAQADRPRIASRIAAIAESATLKVDAKAKALKAAGRPVVSFAAGEPDFATPQHVVDAAVQAAQDPKNHRYTPATGLPELKQAIADKTARESGVTVDPAQVIVTNGGKQAVYQAFQTIVDAGDEVLLPPRTGPPTPRPSGSPAASRSRSSPAATRTTSSPSSSSRPPGPPRRRRCCSARRRTRPARSTPPSRRRPSVSGPSSTASG